MKFNDYMPVKLITGKDCVKNNAAVFTAFGKRCLIITGGNSALRSGALDDCRNVLDSQNISYSVFDKITANPYSDTCYEAGSAAREYNADFIVGIGGGSVLDAAKAVAIYAADEELTVNGIYTRAIPAAALPVILIGTTAGTGSEVTGVSVLTSRDTGRKKSISGADCYAKIAFCDYTYTKTVPPYMTFSTALDAFAHAVESMLNSTANELVFLYSAKAIDLLKEYVLRKDIPEVLSDEEREKLYTASIFAGLAINIAGCGFPHTVGYYLTENYQIPHGVACVAFMPVFLKKAKKYCPDRLGTIESILKVDHTELIDILREKLKFDFAISDEEAAKTALRWKDGVKNFERSPGGFDYKEAEEALRTLN